MTEPITGLRDGDITTTAVGGGAVSPRLAADPDSTDAPSVGDAADEVDAPAAPDTVDITDSPGVDTDTTDTTDQDGTDVETDVDGTDA